MRAGRLISQKEREGIDMWKFIAFSVFYFIYFIGGGGGGGVSEH